MKINKKGGQIFGPDDWTRLSVPINWAPDDADLYLNGFYTSARNAVTDMINGKGSRAALVFPVVYNYRQYLELRMKNLLFLLQTLNNQGKGKWVKGHNLSKIWLKLRPLILDFSPDYPIDEFETIEEIITQFMEVDPKGDAFRYPVNISGLKTIDPIWNRVSVGALHKKMNDIHWALGGLAFDVKAELQERASAMVSH